MLHVKLLTYVCLGCSLAVIPSHSAAVDAAGDSDFLTIVISPEWREKDLQATPSTVNVLSSGQLDEAGTHSLLDAQHRVAGLAARASSGAAEVTLRGVGGTLSPAGDSGVAMFTDGIFRNSATQPLQGLFDIERVEVIKGPQGLHLGRNVLGGAVSIITRDPQPQPSADMSLAIGSHAQREYRGVVNIPVSDTDFSVRLAGEIRRHDGYARDVLRNEDLDDLDYAGWRGKLRYHPTTDLDVVFSSETSEKHDSEDLAQQPDPDDGVNLGILMGGRVYQDPRDLAYNVAQQQDTRSELHSLRITRRTNELEFRSLTSYQDSALSTALDLDGTDVDVARSDSSLDADAFSQEFRLGSKPDLPLSWTAGLYYLRQSGAQRANLRLPLSAIDLVSDSTTHDTAYAMFAELSGELSTGLRLQGGLRYTHEKRRIDLVQTTNDPFGLLGPAGNRVTTLDADGAWDSVTPEVALLYSTGPDTLAYLEASRGFKAGGFNAYEAQPAFDPEYLTAFEAGIKTTLPDWNLRLNAALFHYDYRDMQLYTLPPDSPAGTLPTITNAARAKVNGLDIELWHRPLPSLQLHASATLLDARFEQFDSVDPNNPAADSDHAGAPLPNAPDLSFVLGGSYSWQLTTGRLTLSPAYHYRSAVFFNPFHDPAVRQGGYGIANASLGFESDAGDWYVTLYGENLGDKRYTTNRIRIDPIVGVARHWGAPRTVGLRIGARF